MATKLSTERNRQVDRSAAAMVRRELDAIRRETSKPDAVGGLNRAPVGVRRWLRKIAKVID